MTTGGARRLGGEKNQRKPASRTLLAIQIAIALLLFWQIVTRSVAACLWQVAPASALALAPGNSSARLQLAEWMLGQGGADQPPAMAVPRLNSPAAQAQAMAILARGIAAPMVPPDISAADRAAIQQLAAQAWLSQPLNPRAPRLLGQITESGPKAAVLMARARALSMHEPLANYWLLQAAFLASDFSAALDHADVLLRAQPDSHPIVIPVLARMAENPAGAGPLEAVLHRNPPWRALFFLTIINSIARPGIVSDLLLALQQGPAPATAEEVNACLAWLVKSGLHGQARNLWQRLSPAASPSRDEALFDGNFDAPPSATPFDWHLLSGGGVRLAITAAPGKAGQNALRLEFLEQTVSALEIRQTMVLEPGSHVFSGSVSGDFRASRGLRWQIACAGNPYAPFAASPPLNGNLAGWREFAFAFAVPATGCAAQLASLDVYAVSGSERIVTGTAWFTGLAVRAQK